MKVVAGVIVAVGLCGLVACASETTAPTPAEGKGPANVQSEERGDTVESTVSSDKSDDHLKITFDKKNRSARLAPKFGQAKKVTMEDAPATAAEANRMIAEALDTALSASRSESKGGVKTQTSEPPNAGCADKCAAACDEAYPQACMNAACRFGCEVCCTSN